MAKWEDLNMDCLVNILARVGIESLLLDVPYVCKWWYKATCNPQCWSILDFSLDFDIVLFEDEIPSRLEQEYELHSEDRVDSFIKWVLKRGNRFVTLVKLPSGCSQQAHVFISNECPNLKTLKLSRDMGLDYDDECFSPSLVSKWKDLEKLSLPWCYEIPEIIKQISIHCNYFESLEILDYDSSKISAPVTLLPNLRSLSLRSADISKEELLMILECCKKLEYLDVRDYLGFEETDDDIIKSATHIRSVKLQRSWLYGFDEDYDGYEDVGRHEWFC